MTESDGADGPQTVLHTPEIDAIHPFGKMPVLRHGDFTLCESKAIATYLDRAFDGPSFEDRMATIDFRVAPTAHITVDTDVCRSCTTKACVSACPAGLFVPTSDGGVRSG